MNIRVRLTSEETRARIIAVAEELFRRVGYAKTAVADIAAELGMSPANVYRFFPSKGAINDAICQRLCHDSEAQIGAILSSPASAAERLRAAVLGVHAHNRTLLNQEKRIHDMVAVAMEESWGSIEAHCNAYQQMLAKLIAEGIAAGEFDSALDPQQAAKTVFGACIGFFHPMLIAQCERKAEKPDPDAMVDFLLRALRPRPR